MEETYHYLASITDKSREGHGYVAFAWCGASTVKLLKRQIRMTRNPRKTNCEACKEASALHLLSEV